VCNIIIKKFTFAISPPDEFLFSTEPRDWLGWMPLKWPILCWGDVKP